MRTILLHASRCQGRLHAHPHPYSSRHTHYFRHDRLDEPNISYRLAHIRPESVMVEIALPGWHWEVEFMADGALEIERYRSAGDVEDRPELLEQIFTGL